MQAPSPKKKFTAQSTTNPRKKPPLTKVGTCEKETWTHTHTRTWKHIVNLRVPKSHTHTHKHNAIKLTLNTKLDELTPPYRYRSAHKCDPPFASYKCLATTVLSKPILRRIVIGAIISRPEWKTPDSAFQNKDVLGLDRVASSCQLMSWPIEALWELALEARPRNHLSSAAPGPVTVDIRHDSLSRHTWVRVYKKLPQVNATLPSRKRSILTCSHLFWPVSTRPGGRPVRRCVRRDAFTELRSSRTRSPSHDRK